MKIDGGRRLRLVLALVTVLALVPALGGAQSTAPVRGGTLRIGFTVDATTLNPGLTTQLGALMIGSKLFNGLLEYDFGFVPKPSLAERWEISPDGLTYTFHLRHDVVFHDGQPLTSADVKFSVEKVDRPLHPHGATNFAALKDVVTPDPYTVVFHLSYPFAPFIRVFQATETPILPRHLYDVADIRNNPHNLQPVGTGPFKFKEWVKGDHILLERNERYFKKGQPYLDRIVYQVIPDQATRVASFETGQIDLVPYSGIPNVEAGRVKDLPNTVMTTRGYESQALIMWLEVNTRRKPLGDARVRRAIAHAIDKSFVLNNIWFGIGKVATGPMSSVHGDLYTPEVPTYGYDLAKANRILDEAGYKKGADGVRFKITQDKIPYGDEYVRLAEYVKEQLKKIGIDATTRSTDTAGWFARIWTQWDFELNSDFVGNLTDPSLGMPRFFLASMIKKGVPFTNDSGYQNPEIDRLFAAAARELNPGKRRELFAQIQRILVTDLPYLPILELAPTTFYRKGLENVVNGPFAMYESFDGVYWQKGGK